MFGLQQIVNAAESHEVSGFGGNCANFAIAVQETFNNKFEIWGAFNKALYAKDYLIGHVCVKLDANTFFDVDGFKHSEEEIKAFGMLDETDIDYQELFTKYNIEHTSENFDEVIFIKINHPRQELKSMIDDEEIQDIKDFI